MPMTEEHEQFRTMVRGYVEAKLNPRVAQWEADEAIPLHQVFAEMADLGLLGLGYDPEFGGQGADTTFTLLLTEEMGRCDHGALPMALACRSTWRRRRCTVSAQRRRSGAGCARRWRASTSRRSP